MEVHRNNINKRAFAKFAAMKRNFPLFASKVMPEVKEMLVQQKFHHKLYHILNDFAHGKLKRLIITMPPQHGKSTGSTILLTAFLLGLNPDLKIAIVSYNTETARRFGRDIRRIMQGDQYKTLFPFTQIPGPRDNDINTADAFEIVGRKGFVKLVGRGAGLTSYTVDIAIMDDMYKDSIEANSPVIREKVIDWYANVLRKRFHNYSRELMTFTRWHEDDLIGHVEKKYEVKLIEDFKDYDKSFKGFYKINFQAIKEDLATSIDPRSKGEALWEERHSLSRMMQDREALGEHSFQCLMQGNPISKGGMLYGDSFKTYRTLPNDTVKKGNYTDTADMGDDSLCSCCYEVAKNGDIYLTDVVFSFESMEVTERLVSKMLNENQTKIAKIESNNGGRGFARVLQSLCPNTKIDWFHQSANKESRILTNAATVTLKIHMPYDWEHRWPEFYRQLITFSRTFRSNKDDGAADVLTGIVETETENKGVIINGRLVQ